MSVLQSLLGGQRSDNCGSSISHCVYHAVYNPRACRRNDVSIKLDGSTV